MLHCRNICVQLQHTLPLSERPWDLRVAQIAELAESYGTQKVRLSGTDSDTLLACARFVKRICNGNGPFFEQFAPYRFTQEERHLACSRVLLTAYDDLRRGKDGFFGVFLETESARLMRVKVRNAWEKKCVFEGGSFEGPKQAGKQTEPATLTRHSSEAGLETEGHTRQDESVGTTRMSEEDEFGASPGVPVNDGKDMKRVSLERELAHMLGERERLHSELDKAEQQAAAARNANPDTGAADEASLRENLSEQLYCIDMDIRDVEREFAGGSPMPVDDELD